MFTEAQILYHARERTGIVVTNAVGSEYVSDTAIKSEIRENILECCRAFGSSSNTKEVDFVVVHSPSLSSPGAPTCMPSGSGGTLAAGTYSYFISALSGTKETLVGAMGQATTTGSTSSIALTWDPVANATAYKIYGRSNTSGGQLLTSVTATTWTDTGAQRPSSGPPTRDSTGRWLQEYEIDLFLGSDVLTITECLRADAFRSDANFLEPAYDVDPLTGVRSARGGFIDQSLQQNAFEVMQAQERWREQEKYTWEIVNIAGVRYLRLMPPPQWPAVVRCTYISQANSITALPDEARPAVENAACRAILDCVLNRIKADAIVLEGPLERRAFIEACGKQRDRYEQRYQKSLSMAR